MRPLSAHMYDMLLCVKKDTARGPVSTLTHNLNRRTLRALTTRSLLVLEGSGRVHVTDKGTAVLCDHLGGVVLKLWKIVDGDITWVAAHTPEEAKRTLMAISGECAGEIRSATVSEASEDDLDGKTLQTDHGTMTFREALEECTAPCILTGTWC